MGIRDTLKIQTDAPENKEIADKPAWVRRASKTTMLLYNAAESEYFKVKGLIERGEAASSKSRWLVRAKIAAIAGFDRSLINERRQAELCSWIDQKNHELDELYSLYKPLFRASARKQSRSALEKELAHLRKKDAMQTESDRRAIVETFYSSNMLDDRDVLRQQNSRLKNEVHKLSNAVAQLQQLGRDNEQVISQLWEILEPGQRIRLGWRPSSKRK